MCILLLVAAVAAGAEEESPLKPPATGKTFPLSVPGEYRIGDGITFSATNGRYSLTTGGLAQIAYTVWDYDDENDDENLRDTRQKEEIRLRRLYLWMKGNVYREELKYFLQIDFVETDRVRLLDGYVTYRFLDELQLRAGRYFVPFGRQALTSVGNLEFTDRSPATIAFAPGRDDGITLEGIFFDGIGRYYGGVFSGTGNDGARRRIHGRAYVARIEASNRPPGMPYSEADVEYTRPPLVGIGASWYRNRLRKSIDDQGRPVLESTGPSYASPVGFLGRTLRFAPFDMVEDLDIEEWQADIAFRWRGIFFQSEYFEGKAEGRRSGESIEGKGFYAQGGIFVIPYRLEAAYRYSFVDPSRQFRDDQTDNTGILNWYFVEHNLKLQAEYTRRNTEFPPPKERERATIYRIQFQIKF